MQCHVAALALWLMQSVVGQHHCGGVFSAWLPEVAVERLQPEGPQEPTPVASTCLPILEIPLHKAWWLGSRARMLGQCGLVQWATLRELLQ